MLPAVRMREAPDWWRGTRPSPMPVYGGAIHLRGELSQESFPTFPERPANLQALVVTQAHAEALTVSLDDLSFLASWSEFEGCTFTQGGVPWSGGVSRPA